MWNPSMLKTFILKNRAIIKTVTWRMTADLLTILVMSLMTGRLITAVSLVGIFIVTKTFWFWLHEKVWGLSEKPPKGSKKRSLIKTVTWRILATFDTLVIVLFVTREPLWAGSAALIDTVLKTFFYYLHERVWEHFFRENIVLDLHTHSNFSDGSDSPSALLKAAAEAGCEYLAICDHDNVDHAGRIGDIPPGICYIPGVEISAEYPKTLHILGYGIDPGHHELRERLNSLQAIRKARNIKMVENMQAQGFDISMEELLQDAGGKQIGRPNFASIKLKKAYVKSKQDAFDRYLAKGKSLYMEKTRMQAGEAIRLILKAGGIPVLAHPGQTGQDPAALEALTVELKGYGLRGIEAYYSRHTEEQTRAYLKLAKKQHLLVTAGSDYHGNNKADIQLGIKVKREHLIPFLEALEL